jgi:5-methylcytosine-specific restriction endonuclease McrA
MGNLSPQPGEPRLAGEPSEWFQWVTSKRTALPASRAAQVSTPDVSGGECVPQVGEYRPAGEPSAWFKWITRTAAAPLTSQALPERAADATPKQEIEKPSRKQPTAAPSKPKYKSLRVSELREMRAKLAQSKKEKRTLAGEVKSRLQLDHDCPYCGAVLGADKHADHIHPISKGGLSSEVNMVWVCGACNLRKGSMTLAAFIKKFRLDRNVIEARLETLGKEF